MTRSGIVLTGIKPTGKPHIGNYLGAIQPALSMIEKADCYFFIADYHAITTLKDAAQVKTLVLEVAATWLALGLDPEKAVFYRQSQVPEIFELNWILSCSANKGLLNRAHAYKALVDQNTARQASADDGINMGIFNYPVLMAADILMFGANQVPVGQDQKQHVEIARDIAETVNRHYSLDLPLPEPLIFENVKVVPGIDGRKMSKNYQNTIPIFEEPKPLRKQVMKIVTDSTPMEAPKDPDHCHVMAIYEAIASDNEVSALKQRYRTPGMGYGHAKQALFECLESRFEGPRERYKDLMANPNEIIAALAKGEAHARKVAQATLAKVRAAIGID